MVGRVYSEREQSKRTILDVRMELIAAQAEYVAALHAGEFDGRNKTIDTQLIKLEYERLYLEYYATIYNMLTVAKGIRLEDKGILNPFADKIDFKTMIKQFLLIDGLVWEHRILTIDYYNQALEKATQLVNQKDGGLNL